jgi:hypothetical protein
MRLLHAMLLLPLFGTPAIAQSATPPTTEQHGRRTADQHFADANTTHDGRLTLDQATAGYKSIAKSFSQIDVNRHGYVTTDDIKTWKAAKKAARLAAKHASTDTPSYTTPQRPASWNWNSPEAFGAVPDRIVPTPVQVPRNGIDLPIAPLDFRRPS